MISLSMMNDEQHKHHDLIADALRIANELIPNELAAYQRDPIDSLRSYMIDTNFDSTIRNMLIDMHTADDLHPFDLAEFLANDSDSDRYIDLTRAHAIIFLMRRDALSKLAMSYSLCPLHFCDWAICFDDETDECAAIRTIFPESHDT